MYGNAQEVAMTNRILAGAVASGALAAFEGQDPPSVAIEVVGMGRAWRLATKTAADEIDTMVKTNGDVLGAAAK
jgi:hypothetical protein